MSQGDSAVCDVAIVGGGLAGAVLAVGLGREGFKVVLIDKARPVPPPADGNDLRTVALSLASQRILQRLALWPAVMQRPAGHYRHMHVWDAAGYGSISFAAGDIGAERLGSIVENSQLLAAAWQMLEHLPAVQVRCPAEVTGLSIADSAATLSLVDGGAVDQTITATLVVSAEGGNSQLRELMEIGSYQRDYGQRGIVANIKTTQTHQNTAWQRFLSTGPLAFLPLADEHTSSIVWSSSDHQRLMALDKRSFETELATAFGSKLGDCELLGDRASFPLQAKLAEKTIKHRFALVGDAAHVVHPLAGQGGNLSLLDVAALIDVLVEAKSKKRDIGATTVLRRYQRWRAGENAAMLLSFDGLKHLYGNDRPLVSRLRTIGLNPVDAAKLLRLRFARHAAGVEGDLPSLARPETATG